MAIQQQGAQALVGQIWLCILVAHLDSLGKNLTSLKLTLFRIRIYKEGNVYALYRRTWHKEHHVVQIGASVMTSVPDNKFLCYFKREQDWESVQ